MMLLCRSYKAILGLVFLVDVGAFAASLILQYFFFYSPCPLCIFQRVSALIVALFALILLLLPIKNRAFKVAGAIILFIPALFGLATAARQIYIQNLPPEEIPTCGPGLNFLLANNSFFEFLNKVFMGSGECAELQKFFGLPLSIWGLFTFLVIVLLLLRSFFVK